MCCAWAGDFICTHHTWRAQSIRSNELRACSPLSSNDPVKSSPVYVCLIFHTHVSIRPKIPVLIVCVFETIRFNTVVKGKVQASASHPSFQNVDRRTARYFSFTNFNYLKQFYLENPFIFLAEDKRSRLRPLSFSGLPTNCLSPSSAIAPIHSFPM